MARGRTLVSKNTSISESAIDENKNVLLNQLRLIAFLNIFVF